MHTIRPKINSLLSKFVEGEAPGRVYTLASPPAKADAESYLPGGFFLSSAELNGGGTNKARRSG